MSGLFGSKDPGMGEPVNGLRLQTSVMGRPFPAIFGRNRVSPNLIWGGNFRAEQRITGYAGKGGGDGPTPIKEWGYIMAAVFAIGYGVLNIQRLWIGKFSFAWGGVANLAYTFFPGDTAQTASTWLSSYSPSEALAWRRLSYIMAEVIDMGASPTLPQHSFEVDGLEQNLTGFGVYDCDAKDVGVRILTDNFLGVGFPSANIGDLSAWSNYCRASGILVSPIYVNQAPAAERLSRLADITNTGLYFSEGKLKATPYSDEAAAGNGATYTPNVTPVYDFDDDAFEGHAEPVVCTRSNAADAFNQVSVKIKNRAMDYADDAPEAKDQALIDFFGLRPEDPIDYSTEIADATVGRKVAQHHLQRKLYIRNCYKVKLPLRFFLTEPTDLETVTDAGLGLNRQLVRVLSVDETEDGRLEVEVEEVPANVSAPAAYGSQASAGLRQNLNVDPGNTAAIIVDAPGVLAASGFELWIAASGGADWGGCDIHVSFDNATYQKVGVLQTPCRFGALSAAFSTGADPDTVNTCKVDLTSSLGTLLGGTQAQADQLAMLSWVDGELISYTTATLTASYKYDLKDYIRRGVYNTPISAHALGKGFARLDEYLFKYAYKPELVGKTIYVKLPAFNRNGLNTQDISTLTPFTVVIGGPIGAPDAPTNFVVQQVGDSLNFAVDKVTSLYLDRVEIRYADPGETMWDNGLPVTNILRGNTDTNGSVPPGLWRFMARAYDRAGNRSKTWAVFDFTVTTGYSVISSLEVAPTWPGRQRENHVTRSDALEHADWTASNLASRTAAVSVDQFGAQSMARLVENTSNAEHYVEQSDASLANGATMTACACLLPAERSWAVLSIIQRDGSTVKRAWFNLATGAIGTVQAGVTARISKPSRSGAYNCVISAGVGTGGSAAKLRVGLASADNVASYTGTSGAGLSAGNAQVVAGAVPREYLPTASAADAGPHGNFLVSVSDALVPDATTVAGDMADADLWDTFVKSPQALCTYTAPEMDKSIDGNARIWANIVSTLGPAVVVGTASPKHRIDSHTAAGAYAGFQDWTIGVVNFRYLKSRVELTPALGVAKVTGFQTVVDNQARREDGTYTTTGTGTISVTFNQPFHIVPNVQVTPEGSGDVSASRTGVSKTGFTGFFKSGGVAAAGTADYSAIGV